MILSLFTPPAAGEAGKNKLARASLMLGILGLTCFGFFTGIPGVVCGHIALGQIGRAPGTERDRRVAVWGLITSYGSIVVSILLVVLLVWLVHIYASLARQLSVYY